MDTPITRAEHNEFCKRLEEENKRQDKRIELLEQNTKQISSLTTSVEKLALSVETMCKTQETQSERLETLESRDGEMWRKVLSHTLTAVLSIVIGFVFAQFGM